MDMNQEQLKSGVLGSALVSKLAAVLLAVLTLLVAAQAVRTITDIGLPAPAMNTITVDGMGKVSAAPDVATVSFTVSENGDTASQAQSAATKKTNVAVAVVKGLGIEDKDVKTTSYNLSPRYAYQPPCYSTYCPQESRIVGYTVSQTIEVKVRDLDTVGKTLSALGDAGVSNLYGPNFTIDKEDEFKAEARKEAIQEARAKAKILAKDLGVRIVRVSSYYESGGPLYYGKGGGLATADSAASPPAVPAGENDITVNVTVTYEIR
jgi:hypothetical protein